MKKKQVSLSFALNHRQAIAGLTLSSLLLLSLPIFMISDANAAAISSNNSVVKLDQTQFQFSIMPLAPKLPADGKTYLVMVQLQTVKDNKPIESPYDLQIQVISSDPSIIAPTTNVSTINNNSSSGINNNNNNNISTTQSSSTITLREGESTVKAEIKTTNKPGVASITVLADGVKSASATLSTVNLGALDPSKLAVYSDSPKMVPDPMQVGKLYVQLLNSQNLPALAKTSITVTLSSGNTNIGSIPNYVTIPYGSAGTFVDFIPGYDIGTTKVTASATGLTPGQIDITTAGPIAKKLVVEIAPKVLPAGVYHSAQLSVQLQDENGLPVKATHTTRVYLASSDESVVKVPVSLDIDRGSSYAVAKIDAQSIPDGFDPTIANSTPNATITASASSLESSFVKAYVVHPSPNAASSMKLYTNPSILPPDSSAHGAAVVVQLTDGCQCINVEGKKYDRPAAVNYWDFLDSILTTSNTNVGTVVTGSNTFTVEEFYATANFYTTPRIGKTTLTLSKNGFSSAQADLNVKGSVATSLQLTQIPSILYAGGEGNNGGKGSGSIAVSIVDSRGNPVPARDNIQIYLSSADPQIVTLEDQSITMFAGKSYAIASISVNTNQLGQSTTITASAQGLVSATLPFKTSGPVSQYKLGLYAIPKLPADGHEYENAAAIVLQDPIGNPIPAQSNIPVYLSSSSLIAGDVQKSVVIPAGSTFASVKFITSLNEDDKVKISAASDGYNSVVTQLQTTTQPLVVILTSQLPHTANFGNLPFAVDVYSGTLPVKDAVVTVSGKQANVTTANTDHNGQANSLYIPTQPGTNTVIITASKPGFKDQSITSGINLLQTVNVVVKATTERGNEIATQIKVEAPGRISNMNTNPGSPIKFTNAKWGTYKLTAQNETATSNAIYKFERWSDGITDNPRSWNIVNDQAITAVYSAQYLLQASSSYGIVQGTGYYAEGDKATLSISPTEANNNILMPSSFAGWSGDIHTDSPTTIVTMDIPKTVKAEWKVNYLVVIIIMVAAGMGGFVAYKKILKPRREQAERARAPDLDWYKR